MGKKLTKKQRDQMEKLSAFKAETNCLVKLEQVAFEEPDKSLLQFVQKPVQPQVGTCSAGLQKNCCKAESVFKSRFQPKIEDLLVKDQLVGKKSLCKLEVKFLDLEDLLNDKALKAKPTVEVTPEKSSYHISQFLRELSEKAEQEELALKKQEADLQEAIQQQCENVKKEEVIIRDPLRQYRCDRIQLLKRCQNVQWKSRARDPEKKKCNPCSDEINIGNPNYKQPRKLTKKGDRKPLTEKEKRRRHKQRHPKYPCRFCPGKFKTDKHRNIKGKDGAQGYCKSCAKLHRETIAREEEVRNPIALLDQVQVDDEQISQLQNNSQNIKIAEDRRRFRCEENGCKRVQLKGEAQDQSLTQCNRHVKMQKEAENKVIRDSRGRIIFKCNLCITKQWKRKDDNQKGYPFELCNKHFKNPKAPSKPEKTDGKISFVKD